MKKIFYPLCIVGSGFLWGISGLFVRWLGELGFSTFEITFLRLFIASSSICLTFLIFNRKAFKVKFKDLWCFIGTGTVSVLGTTFFYFFTMENASLSTACVFMYTAPVFIIVLSRILFKEKITIIKTVSLVVVLLGCFLCSIDGNGFTITPLTLLTGLLSGLSYGLYSIFSRYAINKGYTIDTILLFTFIFAFIGSCFIVPYGALIENISKSAMFILPMLGVGLLSGVAPYGLYTLGLRGVSNSKAGIIACLEIVVSLLSGLIAYGEIPSIYNIIGIVLVFVAVIVQEIRIEKKKEVIINE